MHKCDAYIFVFVFVSHGQRATCILGDEGSLTGPLFVSSFD